MTPLTQPQTSARSRSGTLSLVVLTVLAAAALVSTWAGVSHAIGRSQDFQWSGSRMLFDHMDPWLDYLQGDPAHRLIATQVPNYLPVLYVLIAPICLLPMAAANLAWACCNVVFAVISALLAARFYGLRSRAWLAGVTAALLAATPARISISNGQQGLFVLFLWTAGLLGVRRFTSSTEIHGLNSRRALIVGISYLKYSFAPAVVLYLLLREGLHRGWKLLLWSLVPSAIATTLLWLWIYGIHQPARLLTLIVEPLAVAKSGYQPTSDPGLTMMDLGEFLLGGNLVATPRLTATVFCLALAITLAVLLLALRRLQRSADLLDAESQDTHSLAAEATGWLLALMATMSFTLYKHHAYDEVVLLLPMCYALRHRQRPAAWVALALIGYHWYVQQLVDGRIPFSFAWSGIRLVSLLLLLAAVYRIHHLPRAGAA